MFHNSWGEGGGKISKIRYSAEQPSSRDESLTYKEKFDSHHFVRKDMTQKYFQVKVL